jgi:hypothetical protein
MKAAWVGLLIVFLQQLATAQLPEGGDAGGKSFGYDPRPDFIAFDADYREKKRKYDHEWDALKAELIAQERKGRKTHCARQISSEAKWLVHETARFDLAAERLARLRAVLHADKDPHTAEQVEEDGSFGCCTNEWFLKLDNTTDELITLGLKWQEPKHSVRLLARINSPEKLRAYLNSVLVSDVRRRGVDTRTELNHSVSSLTRYILWAGTWQEIPTKYPLDPGLKKALLEYLDNKWQDPETGYWGTWYQTDSGLVKTADLSMTFHIVKFRDGKVNHWPRIVATTLAFKDQEYPYGWLEDGQKSNHHHYDVAALFRLGWRDATEEQKTQIRHETEQMLDWCLTETLNEDGSFDIGDESTLGGAFYFGVSLLNEVGYFSKTNRFWTDREFPEAETVRERIRKKIVETGIDSPEALWALWTLEAAR